MSNEKDWTGNEKTVFVTNGCSNHSKYEEHLMIIILLTHLLLICLKNMDY